jgi:hypothetical protein
MSVARNDCRREQSGETLHGEQAESATELSAADLPLRAALAEHEHEAADHDGNESERTCNRPVNDVWRVRAARSQSVLCRLVNSVGHLQLARLHLWATQSYPSRHRRRQAGPGVADQVSEWISSAPDGKDVAVRYLELNAYTNPTVNVF